MFPHEVGVTNTPRTPLVTSEAAPPIGAVANSAIAQTYWDLLNRTLFGSHAEILADDILLSTGSDALTHRELADRVAVQTQLLNAQGAGPEKLVALKFEPCLDGVVAILAALNAGAGYLPLDPRHGQQRLNQILKASTPDLLLTPDGGFNFGSEIDLTEPSYGAQSLAYVISTSGSTGQPKAPVIEQGGLVNHTVAMIDFLGLGPGDVVLQNAPPSFDISVWQNTTPIIAGSRLHIADDNQRLDPRELWKVLVEEQVTTVQVVPTMLRLMLDCAPPRSELALRNVISTGEALPPDVANHWLEVYNDLPLINMYGPAECSDDVVVHTIERPIHPRHPVPIGRSFAGAVLDVVDREGQTVEAGTVGELVVSGTPVGRGYRNSPELTSKFFSENVLNGEVLRTYRTGDLVIADADGLLRFIGRIDHQVKVRGNRVELGEIESALCSHSEIAAAVVTKFRDDSDRLVAHVELVEEPPEEWANRQAWRDHLSERLPSYMVPGAFVVYPALPLNANGKTDRHALRDPGPADLPGGALEFQAAVTEVEIVVAGIWADTLELDEVGIDSDFFDLGGTSLLAVLCVEKLRSMGLVMGVSDLADHRTVRQLAAKLTCHSRAASNQGEVTVTTLSDGSSEDRYRPPLFLCPGEASPALGFVQLSRHLEHGGAVHVLTPDRSIDSDPEHLSMAELARRAVSAIRKVQPNGPYFLGGFCGGGDLAWEIASQLEHDGVRVLSVLILQTERHGVYPKYKSGLAPGARMVGNMTQRFSFETQTLKSLTPVQRKSHVKHLLLGKVGAKVTVPLERVMRRLPLPSWAKPKRSVRYAQSLWAKADQATYDRWSPSLIAAPVTVLAASRQPPFAVHDPLLGWGDVGVGNISGAVIDGFHLNFLHLPAVAEVAEAMQIAMDRDFSKYLSEGPPAG